MEILRTLVCADPSYLVLETEKDGERFSIYIREKYALQPSRHIILNLKNAFLDYWACAKFVKCCIELLADNGGRITIALNNLIYPNSEQYAWTFFHEYGPINDENQKPKYLPMANRICFENSIVFDIKKFKLNEIEVDLIAVAEILGEVMLSNVSGTVNG